MSESGVTSHPDVMSGASVIAGTRIPARVMACRFASGASVEYLAKDHGLENSQIEDAIRWELAERQKLAGELEQSQRSLQAAQAKASQSMHALESLTVGGSEFVGDVQACVDYVRKKQETLHDVAKNAVKREQAERQRVESLQKALRELVDLVRPLKHTPISKKILERAEATLTTKPEAK